MTNNQDKIFFQYYLVMDEVRCNQNAQLDALNYKADKNPQLKNVLTAVMMQHGADGTRLAEKNISRNIF